MRRRELEYFFGAIRFFTRLPVPGWVGHSAEALNRSARYFPLVGLLVGEGHFGGDGKQPHITLRMHTRHERIFQWLTRTFPDGRLYGPYNHSGRQYYQWMARGAFLRDTLIPLIDPYLSLDLDDHALGRYNDMKARYARALRSPSGTNLPADEPDGLDAADAS
jgi:hypothetical protein